MSILRNLLTSVLAVGFVCSAAAADGVQFLITEAHSSAKERQFAVDVYSDGTLTAFQLDLMVGGLEQKSLSLGKCQSMAKNTSGVNTSCNFVDGVLRFSGVNLDLEPVPKGWHNLGTFSAVLVGKQGLTAGKMMALDKDGSRLKVDYSFEPSR